MVQLNLPKNSRVTKGRRHAAPSGAKRVKNFRIYRYDPETGDNPRWERRVGAVAAMLSGAVVGALLLRAGVALVIGAAAAVEAAAIVALARSLPRDEVTA